MNRTQLVAAIQEDLGEDFTKNDVKDMLDSFEKIVTESCCKGDPVTLTGFVKFARQDRKARQGRNPATGETIQIPAKSVAKVTPLKKFKDAVLESAPKRKTAAKKAPAKRKK